MKRIDFKKGDKVLSIGPEFSSIKGRAGTIVGFSRMINCVGVVFDGDSKLTRHSVHVSFLVKDELCFTTA